ncbi:12999_t:CDS:2 [Ambispora gerdemannii]|uniref:12999_t:CDS:1 n=1 Tax=Ambispora gerdemannii TaxID=144530 RepID=A0A9N9B9E7_9GLOM|nr:12999_t:CDS:2 [Ambispora gerdemannii]
MSIVGRSIEIMREKKKKEDAVIDMELVNTTSSTNSQKAYVSGFRLAILLIGLVIVLFLAALDRTIVATALPQIASDYSAFNQISWVAISYLLTKTAFQPAYGKISDIFGRRSTFIFAICVFEFGSLLSAAAPNIITLIIFRGVQGVGGGGIVSLVMIIIGDIVPLKDRAKYQGIFGAVYGMASLAGPVVGGTFTEHVTWRWCFYVNLPLGAITVAIITFMLHLPPRQGSLMDKIKRIDWCGSILLILGTIALLLALSWGGDKYAWKDPIIIGLLAGGVLLLILFLVVEAFVSIEPISPIHLFKNRSLLACFGVNFFQGMAFFANIYYMPLYFQVVKGKSASSSGFELMPYILAVALGSIISCQIVSRTEKITGKHLCVVGGLLVVVGAILTSLLNANSNRVAQICYLIISGFGVGLIMQTVFICSVLAVEEVDVSFVISIMIFFRSIGAVFGISIVGTIFKNALSKNVLTLGLNVPVDDLKNSAMFMHHLSDAQQHIVIDAYVRSLQDAFHVLIPFGFLCFLCALAIKKTKRSSSECEVQNFSL